MATRKKVWTDERRSKRRFPLQRELRFKILEGDQIVHMGTGKTIDISSRGVAFEATGLKAGLLVELSISWPVLLEETCRMQLIVHGHVLRASKSTAACTIDRYEFRTRGMADRTDISFRHWADTSARELKVIAAHA